MKEFEQAFRKLDKGKYHETWRGVKVRFPI
jgi:hypothetical protein